MSPSKTFRKRVHRSPSAHADENNEPHSPAKRQLTSAKPDTSFASLKLDFAEDLRNVSWAELVEKEEAREKERETSVTTTTTTESVETTTTDESTIVRVERTTTTSTLIDETVSVENVEVMRRARKPSSPKKTNAVPRYFRSLAMAETLENRRSERLRKADVTKVDATKVRSLRKRNVSIDSTATDVPSPRRGVRTSPRKRIPHKTARISSDQTSTPTTPDRGARKLFDSPLAPSPYEDWQEPNVGWCTDENTLKRRSKEIDRAKEKSIYQRYVAEVPKFSRKKGIHPRTPNKYLNYSRRSWDGQVKSWKRLLYQWAGEEPSSSVNTSRCPSECESDVDRMSECGDVKADDGVGFSGAHSKVESLDVAASLMGHFDLETRRGFTNQGDESTLKAPTNQKCAGPTDFSNVVK